MSLHDIHHRCVRPRTSAVGEAEHFRPGFENLEETAQDDELDVVRELLDRQLGRPIVTDRERRLDRSMCLD